MSSERVQESCSASVIEPWLEQHTQLSAEDQRSLSAVVLSLLRRVHKDRLTSIGISGAPGSGKSTLSRALTHCLNEIGVPTCLLSLDDYYFSQTKRLRLAEEIHPLLHHRGVPGTHDLSRLLADCDRIRSGEIEGVRIPKFDKSIDDRAPEAGWRTLETVPKVIVVEGWCIGASPQAESDLQHPMNQLERLQDPDSSWRNHVQNHWRLMYSALKERLDEIWYIRVPNWECVIDWRWQQEQELALARLKSRDEVEIFLAGFERIFLHMQKEYPQWADLVIAADRNHGLHLLRQ